MFVEKEAVEKKILDIRYSMLDMEYCHPAGIYAVVYTICTDKCKDPYRMTILSSYNDN